MRKQSELAARVSSGEGSEKSGQLFAMFYGKVLLLDSTLLVTGRWTGKRQSMLHYFSSVEVITISCRLRCQRRVWRSIAIVVAVFIDYKQFEGKTHRIVGQKGWQEVVDYSLKWEEEHWK